jgi:hypothetical protein
MVRGQEALDPVYACLLDGHDHVNQDKARGEPRMLTRRH